MQPKKRSQNKTMSVTHAVTVASARFRQEKGVSRSFRGADRNRLLTFCFFASNSISLLNSINKLIALSLDDLPIVVCRLTPFSLALPTNCFQFSLHLVCVHFGTSILNCTGETERKPSKFPLAMSAAVPLRDKEHRQASELGPALVCSVWRNY